MAEFHGAVMSQGLFGAVEMSDDLEGVASGFAAVGFDEAHRVVEAARDMMRTSDVSGVNGHPVEDSQEMEDLDRRYNELFRTDAILMDRLELWGDRGRGRRD